MSETVTLGQVIAMLAILSNAGAVFLVYAKLVQRLTKVETHLVHLLASRDLVERREKPRDAEPETL